MYTLAQDCQNSEFVIRIKHKDPFVKQGQQILIYVLFDKLTIFPNGTLVTGGNKIVLPWQGEQLQISENGNGGIMVDTSVGVRVLWKRGGKVVINVPESYRKRMCGLCGNMDGDQSNDMTTKQSLPSRTTKVSFVF